LEISASGDEREGVQDWLKTQIELHQQKLLKSDKLLSSTLKELTLHFMHISVHGSMLSSQQT
jgi:hypothetical protein